MNKIKEFVGYLEVKVFDLEDYDRLINLCSRKNLECWNVIIENECLIFRISYNNIKLLENIVLKCHGQIEIVRKSGIIFKIMKYKYHIAFVPGLFLGSMIYFLLSIFIWNINISGNRYYTDENIKEFLKNENIKIFVFKNSISCEEIVKKIRTQYPQISWASAQIDGINLDIVIKEEFFLPSVTEEENKPIVAEYEGYIDSIVVRSGQSNFKIDDYVNKNEVIINNYVDVINDSNEVINKLPVKADADIGIRTTLFYEDTLDYKYLNYKKTQNERTDYSILFNKIFICDNKKYFKNSYNLNCVKKLKVFENIYLPIFFYKNTSLECEINENYYSDYEINRILTEKFEKYLKNLQKKGIQTLSNSVKIEKNDGCCKMSGTIEAIVHQSSKGG